MVQARKQTNTEFAAEEIGDYPTLVSIGAYDVPVERLHTTVYGGNTLAEIPFAAATLRFNLTL